MVVKRHEKALSVQKYLSAKFTGSLTVVSWSWAGQELERDLLQLTASCFWCAACEGVRSEGLEGWEILKSLQRRSHVFC